MFKTAILLATSVFIVMLFLNLYFRIKILKIYRRLIDRRVDFPPTYILDEAKLKSEIVPKYPDEEETILAFARHIKRSLFIAFIIFLVSLFIGYQYVINR